jgi:hypothetical protein
MHFLYYRIPEAREKKRAIPFSFPSGFLKIPEGCGTV